MTLNAHRAEGGGLTEQILVRGVNWLGDAVMTTPALLRLREAKPRAHITLLTPEKLGDLWTRHPARSCVRQDFKSAWRCPTRTGPRSNSGWRAFPNESVMPLPCGTGF